MAWASDTIVVSMAETLPGRSLGEVISRFIQKLSNDPSFTQNKTPEQIQQEALRRAQETMTARSDVRKAAELQRRAQKAKEWVERTKNLDEKEQAKAFQDVDQGKYPDSLTVDIAKQHLEQVKTVLDVNAPEWLREDVLQHSPQAVELVARITELPADLQKDPDVLAHEVARFYHSSKWSEMTRQQRKEARETMDRVFNRISTLPGGEKRDVVLQRIDPGIEHVHIETLREEDIVPAGNPPKEVGDDGRKRTQKSGREYEEWRDKRIREEQQRHLQSLIDTYQNVLDLPENQPSNNQRQQLREFIKRLTSGTHDGQKIEDISGYPAKLDLQEGLRYIEATQNRLNRLDFVVNAEQQKRYGQTVTYKDLKEQSWFLSDKLSASLMKNERFKDISFQFKGQHWTAEAVQNLMNKGYRKWFYEYADRVFGLGMERVQPSLAQQFMYEDFQNFLYALYGEQASIILSEFQIHWNERSRLDYIIHSIGLGPGDMKRRLEAMSMLQSSDVDYLSTFAHSELAFSFMERETFSIMGDKLAQYDKSVAWLEEKVGDGFSLDGLSDADKNRLLEECHALYSGHGSGGHAIHRVEDIKNLSRKDVLDLLKKEKAHYSDPEFAQRGYHRLQEEIQLAKDTVARGVVLEDIDVWGYADVEIHLVKVSENIERLERDYREGLLTPEERASYSEDLLALQERQKRLLDKKLAKEYEMDPHFDTTDQSQIISELAKRKGLSHIEVRVYDRMKAYLEANGKPVDDTELRVAIWAARTHIIGTGRMAAIGAMMARAPGSGDYITGSWKHAMQAPAFEDLVRAMNVEMFASRFKMAGEMGKVTQAYLRFNLRREKSGAGKESFFDTQEWKKLKNEVQDVPSQASMKIMEFAERDLGIKYSELLAPGFMSTGAQYDGSAWRLDKGVLDEIKTYYLKLQETNPQAILDNQALAIRYLIAPDAGARKQILEKMMRRTPTKFFQLFADKRVDMLREAGLSTDEATWNTFENALKYAETDLWSNEKAHAFREVDLSQGDFDIVKKYLTKLEVKPEDMDKYKKLIEVMQNRLTSERPAGAEYKTYLDGLAEEKIPLTLSLDDFNWKDADMKMLGNLAFPRRTRDIGAMSMAKDTILAFITNRENILSPNDIKEPLKKLLELRDAIDDYVGRPVAEPVVKEIARLIIEFNRDRSMWSLPSWVPLGKTITIQLAELDLRPDAPYRSKFGKAMMTGVGVVGQATIGTAAKITSKIPVVSSVMNWMIPGWEGFAHEPVEHWPHSIAEAISWSVRFTGGHANRWNEMQIDEFISSMSDMGLFTEHPELGHDLRGEFKAGFTMKMAAQLRRYWWVAPVATIAIAATQAIEKEQKGGGH